LSGHLAVSNGWVSVTPSPGEEFHMVVAVEQQFDFDGHPFGHVRRQILGEEPQSLSAKAADGRQMADVAEASCSWDDHEGRGRVTEAAAGCSWHVFPIKSSLSHGFHFLLGGGVLFATGARLVVDTVAEFGLDTESLKHPHKLLYLADDRGRAQHVRYAPGARVGEQALNRPPKAFSTLSAECG
jgi:hypothetical protein